LFFSLYFALDNFGLGHIRPKKYFSSNEENFFLSKCYIIFKLILSNDF